MFSLQSFFTTLLPLFTEPLKHYEMQQKMLKLTFSVYSSFMSCQIIITRLSSSSQLISKLWLKTQRRIRSVPSKFSLNLDLIFDHLSVDLIKKLVFLFVRWNQGTWPSCLVRLWCAPPRTT